MYTSISERDDRDNNDASEEAHGHEERYCPYCYGVPLERLTRRHFKCPSCSVGFCSVLAWSENCDCD